MLVNLNLKTLEDDMLDAAVSIHAKSFSGGEVWGKETFQNYLRKPVVYGFCAFDQSQMAGFAVFQKIEDVVELLTIAVNPAHRKKGVGRHVLEKGLESLISQESSDVFLDVAVDNQAAMKLYQSLGFQRIAVREKYYKRGLEKIDAYVFKKHIIATANKDQYSDA